MHVCMYVCKTVISIKIRIYGKKLKETYILEQKRNKREIKNLPPLACAWCDEQGNHSKFKI